MPKIEIRELDLTTPGNLAAETDVVYIPGFVDTEQLSLNTDGVYHGLKPFVPTLITTMSQFKTLCGTRGARFEKTQYYTDLIEARADGTYTGFNANAVPYNKTMFEANTIDPSYVMAKELIQAGLPVVYERINPDMDYIEIKTEPSNWKNTYKTFYTEKEVFRPISSTNVPALFTHLSIGDEAPVDSDTVSYTFYTRKIDDKTLNQKYSKVDRATVVSEVGFVSTECFVRASDAVKYYDFHDVANISKTPEFEANKYYTVTETICTSQLKQINLQKNLKIGVMVISIH